MLSAQEASRDRQWMSNSLKWPGFLCPLKNRDGRIGYLVESEPIVSLGNIWSPKDTDEKITYPDWEGLQDAGWRVD